LEEINIVNGLLLGFGLMDAATGSAHGIRLISTLLRDNQGRIAGWPDVVENRKKLYFRQSSGYF
jgi:hypothetical protein